jgi:glycosyltransferase involved in cell wall biosynthesis
MGHEMLKLTDLFETEWDQECRTGDMLQHRKHWLAEQLKSLGIDHPLRVLIATNSIGCGGEEHQVMRLVPELRAIGLDMEHLYYSAPHTLKPKYKARGIDSVFIDKNIMGQIKFWKELIGYIRKNRFDVVHAFGGTANIYVKGAAIAAGTRTILSGSRSRYLRGGIFCNLSTSLLNVFSNSWVMNSITNLDGLRELYYHRNARAYVLPNALEFSDRDYITKAPLDSDLKKWIDGRLIVASVGGLSYPKNFEMFVDVAKQVRGARNDVCFCIVGDPVCTSEGPVIQDCLQNRIREENLGSYLKMTGGIDDIPSFLTNVDVLVSTSRSEGCPNVVLEAMRAARPIVMTDSCDTDKIIQPGVNGFVVGLDDLVSMTEHILHLLSSEQVRSEFGQKSREVVEKNFSSTNAAWSLAKIYLTEFKDQSR